MLIENPLLESAVKLSGENPLSYQPDNAKDSLSYLKSLNQDKTPESLRGLILTLGDCPNFPLAKYHAISEYLLRTHHVPKSEIDYFTSVTLPVLYVLHHKHRKGYVDLAGDILWDLCLAGHNLSSEHLTSFTQGIVEFVQDRPLITREIARSLQDEMKSQDLQSLSVRTIALIGSYARSDSHLYSDVDILIFGDKWVSFSEAINKTSLNEFAIRMDANINNINVHRRGLNNVGGGVFGLNANPEVEVFHRVNPDDPIFRYVLIGEDIQAKKLVDKILGKKGRVDIDK